MKPNIVINKLKCVKCKWEWTPRVVCPAVCPKCKTHYYMPQEPSTKTLQKAKAIFRKEAERVRGKG